MGEKGQKVIISDEGKFDPASIPKKRWEEYQAELWDAQTQQDDRSEVSGISYATKSWHMAGSGPHSEYMSMPPSRPMSHLDLPPRYPSRMSLAPSQHFASGEMEMSDLPQGVNLPTDDAILAEIRDILSKSDLMTVTKKIVKQELESRFQVNLDAKRHYISSATEAVLSGQV